MAIERKPEFIELVNARTLQATQLLDGMMNEFKLEDENNPADYKKVLSKMLVQFSQDQQTTNISGLSLEEQSKIIAGLRIYTRRTIASNILNSVVEATRNNQAIAIILKDRNEVEDTLWMELSYMFEGPVDKLRGVYGEAKESGIKMAVNILTAIPESTGGRPTRAYLSTPFDETPHFTEESRLTSIEGITIHERKSKNSSRPYAVAILVDSI